MKHQTSNSKVARGVAVLVLGVWMFSGAWSLVLGASVEVDIDLKVSGEPIQSASLRYQTSAGENFSITRVSYLLAGFALERTDGSWLELTNQVAWMDLEANRSTLRIPNVLPDSYRGIRFHLGPDAQQNHADPARLPADHPLNPNLNNLHWNWQGGYIFLALEGLWRPGSAGILPASRSTGTETRQQDAGAPSAALDGWSYHFARDTNRTRINLAASLDLTRDTRLELDFDIGTLLNAPRSLSFAKDGSSTHSREGDPIAAALAANLPGAFHVRHVSTFSADQLVATNTKPLYLPEKFTPYRFQMSSSFPIPDLPRNNPLIEERVALGEKLFHEPALSKDNSLSCASCHDAKAAFADPRRFSIGVREQVGTRNTMPLFNLAWKSSFFWDGRAQTLRAQALMPIQDHTEMDESLTNVVAKLGRSRQGAQTQTKESEGLLTSSPTNENNYPALFSAAFGSPEITPEKIGLAIESFVLTLTSFDSKFDRALRGEAQLTDAEKRGFELFMTEYDPRREQYGADCFHCHGGPLFQSQTFANNGLDSDFNDRGRARITGKESDAGKFAAPSLRNIALTAPYMHDGRFTTLDDVVEHYATGIKRSATLDPNIAKHPDGGVPLSDSDKKALVAFLQTLTDPKY